MLCIGPYQSTDHPNTARLTRPSFFAHVRTHTNQPPNHPPNQAFWPGLQVLAGELPTARTSFRAFYSLWQRFQALPELFDVKAHNLLHVRATPPIPPISYHYKRVLLPSYDFRQLPRPLTSPFFMRQFGHDYPLRPELIESAYHLYAATRDPYYLSVGKEFLFVLQVRPPTHSPEIHNEWRGERSIDRSPGPSHIVAFFHT
jgi:hypothetical protein